MSSSSVSSSISRLILALGISNVAAANSASSFARFAALATANASVDSISCTGSSVDDSQSTVDDALSSLSLNYKLENKLMNS